MDIVLKPVVYIFLALFSLGLLIIFVPSILSSAQKSYCSAFLGSNLIASGQCEGINHTNYQDKITIGPNDEGKIISAIATCHQRPVGFCYLLYFEADINKTKFETMMNSSGISFSVKMQPETFRSGTLLSMYNDNQTVVIK